MKKVELVLPGYLVGLGGLALITYRTLVAFFSTSKSVTVSVNRFGEQYLDVVVLVFLWAVCILGIVSLWVVVRGRSREKSNHEEPSVVSTSELVGSLDGRYESYGSTGQPVFTDDSAEVVDPAYSFLADTVTNEEYSFSVQVVVGTTDEENRY